jgi:ribosomal protein L20
MYKLKSNNILINRKVLADIAMNDSKKFGEIVKKVK